MDAQPPADSTVEQHEVVAEAIPKRQLKFSSTVDALHPFQQRFVFWSPAVLYLLGGLTDVVLTDFMQSYGQDVQIFHHRFRVPLFRGLETMDGNPDWNHVLWAVEREHWEPLLDFLCSASLVDRHNGLFFSYAMQEVDVCDPLFIERNAFLANVVPVLTVPMMCVKTNRWVAAFDLEGAHPVLAPAKLTFYPADDRCKMYADAVLSVGEGEAGNHLLTAVEAEKETDDGDSHGLSSGDGG